MAGLWRLDRDLNPGLLAYKPSAVALIHRGGPSNEMEGEDVKQIAYAHEEIESDCYESYFSEKFQNKPWDFTRAAERTGTASLE
ncbi:hypothetical protein ANN_20813 [Periplaneta americana]|uniref:Uncharacterized protein n=1 Tax=Periplaneta americana TaxID=6978 RepID=A0ABQ8SE07_PERAM|nr:hypothetical protein ANN_20813 [Periplaneta americana]